MFSLQEIRRAHEVVLGVLRPTPALNWPLLDERLGAEVVVKHENHLPTGAFKVRGGLTYVDALIKREPATRGLISATRGNHGQSLAFAGRRAGLKVTILAPQGNSSEKNAAMRALGAELIEFGRDFQASREEAMRLASARGLHAVPSFHRDLALGVSTYALELLSERPDLDVLYVPIGQGSGICGCISARDALGLKTEIVGVQSTEAPAYSLSFAAGRVVPTNSADTLADGMATQGSRSRGARGHHEGSSPDHARQRRRSGRCGARLLDRYAQPRRGRGRGGARGCGKGAIAARRTQDRARALGGQHRLRSLPAVGRGGAERRGRVTEKTFHRSQPGANKDMTPMSKTSILQPLSPYSSSTAKHNIETHTLSVLVDNEPGVLARVVGMFSGRGYNIESLTVAEVAHETHLSRITIVTSGTPEIIEQIRHQTERLVPVHAVTDLTLSVRAIERELAMIKVRGKGENRVEAMRLADAFRAKVIDATTESFIFELTGAPRKIDDFVELMRPIGLVEVSRTGVAAISRGPEPI